jgi:hypothetical protein
MSSRAGPLLPLGLLTANPSAGNQGETHMQNRR